MAGRTKEEQQRFNKGYGEFHRLNKRYFEYLWKRSEEDELTNKHK